MLAHSALMGHGEQDLLPNDLHEGSFFDYSAAGREAGDVQVYVCVCCVCVCLCVCVCVVCVCACVCMCVRACVLYVCAVIVSLSALNAWGVVSRRRRSTWGCMPSPLECESLHTIHARESARSWRARPRAREARRAKT